MKYIILIISFALLLIARIEKKHNIKIYNFILVILFTTLIVYSGFREFILPFDEIGKDYFQYKDWFFIKNNINITSFSNISFILLIKFLNIINGNYILLFVISSFIILLGVFKFVLKNSKYFEVSIYIYITLGFLLSGFNVIRQWIVCSIFLLAYEYIKSKDFKKYFVMILFASTFHASGLFLIALYPVLNNNLKLYKRVLIIVILIILLTSSNFTMILLSNTKTIDNNFYSRYISGEYGSQSNYVVFYIALINLIIILLNIKTYKKQHEYWNIEINYLMLLCAFAFAAPTHIIYNRAVIYFMPALLVTIPNMIDLIKGKNRNIIYLVILTVFLIPYIL